MQRIYIKKPTLIIDTDRVKLNIDKAVGLCEKRNIQFRPHFKTHRSETIGELYMQAGIKKITVSSVTMARYFALRGFWDITIAFPANISEIEDIDKLAGEINLNLLFDSIETVVYFNSNLQNKVGAFIEIDDGYRRTGIDAENFSYLNKVADRIIGSEHLEMMGILCHSGRTYIAGSEDNIRKSYSDSMFKMLKIKEILHNKCGQCILSVGDTPSFFLSTEFNGVDEARPGVFVYFDAMMESFGVCTFNEIAMTLAAPIIGKYPDRCEIALYAGAVHLSKDTIRSSEGINIFGYISKYRNDGTLEPPSKKNFIRMISQEHGIAQVSPEFFRKVAIGDIAAIVPVHACLTSDATNRGIDRAGREVKLMPES